MRKVKQKAASKRWQFEYIDSKAPDESESESGSGQVEVHTKEVEASLPTLAPSSRTIFRLNARLIGLLPSNPIDHLDHFIMSLYSSLLLLYWTQKNYEIHSALSMRQRRYRAQRVSQLLEDTSEEANVILLKYWLSKLVLTH